MATGIIRYHAHWIMMMPESKYEKISKFGMLAAGANAWVKLGQTTRIGMCVCVCVRMCCTFCCRATLVVQQATWIAMNLKHSRCRHLVSRGKCLRSKLLTNSVLSLFPQKLFKSVLTNDATPAWTIWSSLNDSMFACV